jgi:hypothetical protein
MPMTDNGGEEEAREQTVQGRAGGGDQHSVLDQSHQGGENRGETRHELGRKSAKSRQQFPGRRQGREREYGHAEQDGLAHRAVLAVSRSAAVLRPRRSLAAAGLG